MYQSAAIETNSVEMFIDKIVTNEAKSLSYVPVKYFKKKENMMYAELLRDMNSFPSNEDFVNGRAMLIDGKRIFGQFAKLRFVVYQDSYDKYFEINSFNIRTTNSERSYK